MQHDKETSFKIKHGLFWVILDSKMCRRVCVNKSHGTEQRTAFTITKQSTEAEVVFKKVKILH